MLKSILLLTTGFTALSLSLLLTKYFGDNKTAIRNCRIVVLGNLTATVVVDIMLDGMLWKILYNILNGAVATVGALAIIAAFFVPWLKCTEKEIEGKGAKKDEKKPEKKRGKKNEIDVNN